MLFKYKFITKYLFFVLITLCTGQQYFSPLIPNNYFIPNAADLAKGVIFSGPFSDNIFKDAAQNYNLEINVIRNSYAERRSFPVIDMFDDVVTQNVYALNRPAFTSYAWSFSADLNQKYKMPFLVSISDGLFWDFRYDYNEEVRASLGPGVYNRDPVAGYHVVNVEGAIRSFELGLSTSIGDKAKVGLIFENFYEDDISYIKGVNVFNQDEALASDTTNIRLLDLSVEGTNRITFGSTYDIKENISIGFNFKPKLEMKFSSDGLMPVLDAKTQLPNFEISDSASFYSVNLPSEMSIGFSLQVNNPTETYIHGGFVLKDWDKYDTYEVSHSKIDTAVFNYQPTFGFSLGVEHIILGKTPLRFGFLFSESPLGEEFEITKFSIGSGFVFDNLSVDVSAIFGANDYRYQDLFQTAAEENSFLDRVDESSTVIKATVKYSFN